MNSQCSRCGKETSKLFKCSRCHSVRYCGKECQRADWTSHKPQCRPQLIETLEAYFAAHPAHGTAVRVEQSGTPKGRFLIALRGFEEGEEIFTEKALLFGDDVRGALRKYFTLTEHGTSDGVNLGLARHVHPKVVWELHSHDRTSPEVIRRMIGPFFANHEEEAVRLLPIVTSNAHSCGKGRAGVFLMSSMICHSCVPNARFSTWEDKLRLGAIAPIRPGDEITISYDNSYLSTTLRRQKLRATYGFDCICPRCRELPDLYRAFHCPKCNEKLCPRREGELASDWVCDSCRHQLDDVERMRLLDAERSASRVRNPKEMKEVIKLGVHKHHHYFFNMVNGMVERAGDPSLVNWIAHYLVEAAEQIPEMRPLLIELYDLLSQASLVNGARAQAKLALRKRWRVRQILDGMESPHTHEAEKEWRSCC